MAPRSLAIRRITRVCLGRVRHAQHSKLMVFGSVRYPLLLRTTYIKYIWLRDVCSKVSGYKTDVYKVNTIFLSFFLFSLPRFRSKTDRGNNNNYYYILRRRAPQKKKKKKHPVITCMESLSLDNKSGAGSCGFNVDRI